MERMIETSARVVALEPGGAWVEAQRQTVCSHCGSAASCGTGALARLLGRGPNRLRIADPVGLRLGEQVSIGIPADSLLGAALIAYLLPLALLVLTAALATAAGLSEGQVALLGLSGLGAGLGLSGWLSNRRHGDAGYQPRLIGHRAPRAPTGTNRGGTAAAPATAVNLVAPPSTAVSPSARHSS